MPSYLPGDVCDWSAVANLHMWLSVCVPVVQQVGNMPSVSVCVPVALADLFCWGQGRDIHNNNCLSE